MATSGRLTACRKSFRAREQRAFSEHCKLLDSYGEASGNAGKTKEALAAYEKALSIDPKLPSAIEAVKTLKEQ